MKILLLSFYGLAALAAPLVSTIRVPEHGIQPQIVAKDGIVHLIYFTGDPAKGNLSYVKSSDYGNTFSKPIRVNSVPGAAMALGNIRGAQLAIGKNGRVHIAWNGSATQKTPMLYTRLNDAGTAFEPQRNLIHTAFGIDGGGSIAADSQGSVYVFWHAPPAGQKGEDHRRIWMSKSTDDGKTFAPEKSIFDKPTGVCGCCGMKALVAADGTIRILFRAATETVHRDIYLISSSDRGATFHGADISHWNIGACVMSSQFLTDSLAAWESEKQVYFGRVDSIDKATGAPGNGVNRKYPVLATSPQGETLFAWTENTAWKKGGKVAWQVYGKALQPEGNSSQAEGVPVWSLVAAFARPDGSFAVVY